MHYFAIAALLLLAYPCLRFFFKRAVMYTSIRIACKRYGFAFRTVNPLWLFARIKRLKPDFFIASADALYSVKLIGVPDRRMFWQFSNGTDYAIRDLRMLNRFTRMSAKYKPHRAGKIDFTYGLPAEWADRKRVDAVLMSPLSASVTLAEGSFVRHVSNGDFVHWGIFYSKSGLLEEMKNIKK